MGPAELVPPAVPRRRPEALVNKVTGFWCISTREEGRAAGGKRDFRGLFGGENPGFFYT